MTMDAFAQGVTETIMEWTNESVAGEERDTVEKPIALIAIEGFTLLIITFVAIAANVTAITIILRVRSLRQNPHNLLILNLSVADLGVALTSMTFSLMSVFDGGYVLLRYHNVCLGHAFLAMIFSYVNFPTIVCIAVDRVLIVTHKFPLSHARAYRMIACCWIIALTNVMFPTNNWFMSGYAYLPETLHCSPVWHNRIFRIIYAIINYGVVIIILTTCYIIITYHLRKKGQQLRCHQKAVPTRTLNTCTSMSSYQTPLSTEMKGTAQTTSLSSSGIQHPSSVTTTFDPHVLKSSPTGEPQSCLDQSPQPLDLSSEIAISIPSEIQLDDPLQNNNDQRLNQLYLEEKEEEKKDEEEGKKDKKPRKWKDGHAEQQMQKEDKQSSSKPASPVEAVNAVPTQSGSTNKTKEFYSVTETRPSQGLDSDMEGKGNGTRNVRADQKKFKAEKRVALMGALLVLTTMLCWTPYVLYHSKYLGLPEGHWFGVFTMWLGYCNALLDPLIYSFMNFRVRREIKRFFRSASAVCNPVQLLSQ